MSHSCAEPVCGYVYPEVEFQGTPQEARKCPQCGSRRINAQVTGVATIRLRAHVHSPSIMMSAQLWSAWIRIGIDHTRMAQTARRAAQNTQQGDASEWMAREFESSIVAVAASAHALDALYGSTAIPDAIHAQWERTGTKRRGKIREALKQVFATGPVNKLWAEEFDWLFKLRDAAAHAREELNPTVQHPLGMNVAPEHVKYSVESAYRAVAFALSVLRWCVDHPRLNLSASVHWSSVHRPTIEGLEQQWTLKVLEK